MSVNIIKRKIIESLEKHANIKYSIEIGQYLKNIHRYRGIKAPQLNQIYKEYIQEIKGLDNREIYQLGEQLIMQPYGEDKQAGLMVLKNVKFDSDMIKQTENWFLDAHICDWPSCDGFCSSVLRPWVFTSIENANVLINWAKHECLWMRRASCVTFVVLPKKTEDSYIDLMFNICDIVIKHQQRFNQLGCGWLLRVLSTRAKQRTIAFTKDRIQYFTAEGLRYTTEKMTNSEKQELKLLRNSLQQKNITQTSAIDECHITKHQQELQELENSSSKKQNKQTRKQKF